MPVGSSFIVLDSITSTLTNSSVIACLVTKRRKKNLTNSFFFLHSEQPPTSPEFQETRVVCLRVKAIEDETFESKLIWWNRKMVLPILKLGTLAIRTACKPIAKRIKKEAGLHPEFRLFIINIAQANHRFTTQMQRIIYNHSTDVAIRPLNEEKAVKAAADLLGEMFVFTVAGTAVIFEVQRSAKSEAKKEEMRRQEILVIQQQNESLAEEVELLRKRVEELEKQAKETGFIGMFSQNHNHTWVDEHTKPVSAP
ncbi:hypothetical protein V2J09_019209 [Rumex salicifolius]